MLIERPLNLRTIKYLPQISHRQPPKRSIRGIFYLLSLQETQSKEKPHQFPSKVIISISYRSFLKSVLFGLAATNGIALNSAFRNQKTPIDTAKQLFPGDLIPNKTSNKQDFELNGADTESFLQTMDSTAEFHSPGSFVSHRIPISKITKSIKLPCSNTNTRPGWVSDRTHLKEYKRGILFLIPPYTLNRFNSR